MKRLLWLIPLFLVLNKGLLLYWAYEDRLMRDDLKREISQFPYQHYDDWESQLTYYRITDDTGRVYSLIPPKELYCSDGRKVGKCEIRVLIPHHHLQIGGELVK